MTGELHIIGKNINGELNAAALVRVSSKDQGQTQHGSLEQQANAILRRAEQFAETGSKQIKLTVFVEEVSGRGSSAHKRDGLREIRRLSRQGKLDILFIEKLDRLGRDSVMNRTLIDEFAKADTQVITLESGKVDFRDRGSRLSFNINNMLAEEYSLELEEKVTKKQREARVNNGKDTATMPILGLDPHPTKTGFYIPNEDELVVVREIMTKFCEYKSYVALVAYCKEKGYRTRARFTQEKIDKNGNRIPPRKLGDRAFDQARLRSHLLNPKYRGYGFFKDDWNQFPKLQDKDGNVRWEYHHRRQFGDIIDLHLLENVYATAVSIAKVTRAKSNKDGTYSLLSGALKGWDGKPFYHETAGDLCYYTSASLNIRIRKQKLDDAVLKRIKEYLGNSGTLRRVLDTALKHRMIGAPFIHEEIQKHERNVAHLKSTVEGLNKALRDAAIKGGDGLLDVCTEITKEKLRVEDELTPAVSALETSQERLKVIEARLNNQSVEGWLQEIMAKFDEKTDLQKRRIVQAVIPEMILHEDNRLELRINPDPSLEKTSGCHGSSGGKILGINFKWRPIEKPTRTGVSAVRSN